MSQRALGPLGPVTIRRLSDGVTRGPAQVATDGIVVDDDDTGRRRTIRARNPPVSPDTVIVALVQRGATGPVPRPCSRR
jgi:hypothetical protein